MKHILTLLLSILPLFSFAQVNNVKKGDIITINGIKGIVFSTNEDGDHGKIMSIKAFRSKENLYCAKASMLKNVFMNSETDGKANTEELYSFAEQSGTDLANYPVFKWCKSLGPGWYIPAIEELKVFINFWVGNTDVEVDWEEDGDESSKEDESIPHTRKINDAMMAAGGIPFLNGVFTSTLDINKKIDIFEYNKVDGKWTFKKVNPMKVDAYCVGRAFYDF